MKTRIILISLLIIPGLMAIGQRASIELTFTAENNGTHIQLDSIRVMNRTQGSDTTLYWPDTMLSFLNTEIHENIEVENVFQVLKNYPNPMADHSNIYLCIPEKDKVSLFLTNMLGKVVLQYEGILDRGCHSFRFNPGSDNLYFFTAHWKDKYSTIKILHVSSGSDKAGSLEYLGDDGSFPQYKATADVQNFLFFIGDVMLYIGYANAVESGIVDSPEDSKTYTFQFATNIPCPGTPTVEYEGQVYGTIQVLSQCWLKKNLNVGEMIPGTIEPSNNGTIEKYCYNNEPDSCAKYGGLYQYWEMMQYNTNWTGICPPGWHLPTDEEWKVLEGLVDSQYGIGDPEWDISYELRGLDAGTNLKSISNWYSDGNGADLYGFSAMPGGYRHIFDGYFYYVGNLGYWWSSNGWIRSLGYDYPTIGRHNFGLENGFSVRCLQD